MASEQPPVQQDPMPAAPERQVSETQPARNADRQPELQAHIGSKLKALYAEVVNQPVPDRLVELVRRLEAREGKGNG